MADAQLSFFQRSSVRWTGLFLAALILAGLGVHWLAHDDRGAAPPVGTGLSAPEELVEVQVTKPLRRTLAYTVSLPANIAPWYQTTLYAKVSGYLKWIGPDKGDRVKRNEVVAVIDAPEIEEQYQQAVADYKIKKLTFERLENVWKTTPDVIARQDVDVAQAAYEGAKNQMEQRAALRDYTKVRAPYDGVVTARFADPGALIQIATSSATTAIPLFTVMDLSTVRVYANVPQDDTPLVVPGKTKALVNVKELEGRTFEGTVTRSTLALDPTTRSMLIEIDLPNPDQALRPGTFAEVVLALREIPGALVLPPNALSTANRTKLVYVVDQGRAKPRLVQTGISDGTWLEIVSGLTEQDEVVVVGKSKLTDGTPVKASPYNLPAGQASSQRFERRTAGVPASNGTNGANGNGAYSK
ncbi:HlyD_D23 domain-containing protein [Nitrospira tepida]|uniref:HlyD_D23 domain-containing protein n=1 Tax=Nitrospira tepida TaxID=2973512 RepID=A0AA86T4G2_9BACT|nr:efflux RND transporter periplasmic adaptor subunit [Nitrospira tepida]CAI4031544.1 HlyD_D23 domain-containing protein [Nitrospira tepida]